MKSIKSCPVCKSNQFQPFDSQEDQGHLLSYSLCANCGLVFQTPRMEESELQAFYAGAYREHQQSTDQPVESDLLMQVARARKTLAMMNKKGILISRHLDIGSSSGALLREFNRHFHCESVGIEPGEAYRSYSQERGDRIYRSQSELIEANERPFDLISMMHVLEHLPDPINELSTIRRTLLSQDGWLLLEVPNLFEHASFELAHLFAFSKSSLREVLRQAGYEIKSLRAHGSFRSPILKLYLTALARPLSKTSSPRRWYFPGSIGIATRRRLGTWKRSFFSSRWPDWTWQSPAEIIASTRTSPEDEHLAAGRMESRE